MSKPVRTIAPPMQLAEAAKRLIEGKIGALPVVEKGKLMGMLTETDLLRVFVMACEQ